MKTRKIFEAMAIVTAISAVTRVIAFVFKIYLSRALGAEMLGVYQITISIFMLATSLSASGIPTALSRHLASLTATGDRRGACGILTSALCLSSGIAILTIIFFYIFPNITALLFTDSRCTEMFVIMLPALLSTSIYAVIRSYFWSQKNFFLYSISECGAELLSIMVIVVTLVLGIFKGNMSKSVAYAYVISDYIGVALLIVLFISKGGRMSKPTYMSRLVRSSTPITCTRLIGAIMSSMMALLIPTLLVKHGMSTSLATASYGRASGMVMSLIFAPSTIVGALAVVIIPELASSTAVDKSAAGQVVSPAISFSVIIACLFISLYIAEGDRLCTFLYHDSIAGEYLERVAILMLPMSINQICVSLLNTMGYESKTMTVHLIASATLTLLIFILPKHIGIYSYFVGLIVFHTLSSIMYLILITRLSHIPRKCMIQLLGLIAVSMVLGRAIHALRISHMHDFLAIVLASLTILLVHAIYLIGTRMVHVDIFTTSLSKNIK